MLRANDTARFDRGYCGTGARARTRRSAWMRLRGLALGGVSLLALMLCACTPRASVPPVDVYQALERVNTNLSQVDEPLYYKARVRFSFRDNEGRKRHLPGSDARVIFSQPNHLLFDIKGLTGVIAQLGSNAERYWFWVEPEVNKLWWGTWTAEAGPQSAELPVPPDQLLDALMLRPLPTDPSAGLMPALRVEGTDYRLLYTFTDALGNVVAWREIKLDRYAPYQPVEIVDRLPAGDEGGVLMRASLGTYKRVGGDGPYTARHYDIRWPQNDARMVVDIGKALFRPELPESIFAFPEQFPGTMERIDAPRASAAEFGLAEHEPVSD